MRKPIGFRELWGGDTNVSKLIFSFGKIVPFQLFYKIILFVNKLKKEQFHKFFVVVVDTNNEKPRHLIQPVCFSLLFCVIICESARPNISR